MRNCSTANSREDRSELLDSYRAKGVLFGSLEVVYRLEHPEIDSDSIFFLCWSLSQDRFAAIACRLLARGTTSCMFHAV
jgi:hypothetical protein